jgi:hypothetical protein
MYIWIKLLHILGLFAFVMAHGASASMALRLQREKDLGRIRAMLELSSASLGVLYAALGIAVVAGIAAGFAGHWWNRGWIWLSLVLLLALVVAMSLLGTTYYHRVRKAVGLGYLEAWKSHPPIEAASKAEVTEFLARGHPALLALIGGGGLALIIGLMTFKPF